MAQANVTFCWTYHSSPIYFKTGIVEDTMSNKYVERMRSAGW